MADTKEQGLPKLPKPYLEAGAEYIGNYSRYNLYTEPQTEAYALAALASDTGERGVVDLADELYALAKNREFNGLRVSMAEVYEHVAKLRALRAQPAVQGCGEDYVSVPLWFMQQVFGMAREGCNAPTAAYRWCERIDALFFEPSGRDEYAEWEAPLPAPFALTQPQPVAGGPCPHCGSTNTGPTSGNGVGNTHDCRVCFTDFTPPESGGQGEAVAWAFEQDDGWGEYEKRLAYSRAAGERQGCRNLRPLYTHPPAQASGEVTEAVLAEVEKATRKFPTWPTDPLHAFAVLGEEVGELQKAILEAVYEPHKAKPGEVEKEAVQAAAMALRFLMSLGVYEYAPGQQHSQAAFAQGGGNGR